MIIKIERTEKKKKTEKPKKSKQPRKQRKVPTIKVGTHKKINVCFYGFLLIGSVGFGIYKNVTAIDTHTIHETEIIEQQVVDTNQVERFVESFARVYYSWEQAQEKNGYSQ